MSVPAIVLDANQRSALATIRSLGRAGVRVIACDSRRRSIGGASRHASTVIVCPDPVRAPADFIAWLRELAVEFPDSVLLPMTDITLGLVAEASLDSLFRLPFCDAATLRQVTDKYALYKCATRLGIDVPRTMLLKGPEYVLPFAPAVVKVRSSRVRRSDGGSTSVSYVRDEGEFRTCLERLWRDGVEEVLVQEKILGSGAGVFGLYHRGARVAHFAHERLKEKPPSGGVSVLSASRKPEPQLLKVMDSLLEPLSWNGVAMAEFKRTPEGRYVLIEVNTRLWGSTQLAVDCGVDFPLMLYRLALGEPVRGPDSYLVGRKLRWYLGMLDHIYLKGREGTTLPRVIGDLLLALFPWAPGTRMETFRWRDPLPFFSELRQYVRE
jgi:predicted ATP-grasp superfamily ATP-dependent carboligase